MAKDVENVVLVERAACPIEFIRRSGSFTNKDGELIEYTKYFVSIDGAEVSVDLEKDARSLVDHFVTFEEIDEDEE